MSPLLLCEAFTVWPTALPFLCIHATATQQSLEQAGYDLVLSSGFLAFASHSG